MIVEGSVTGVRDTTVEYNGKEYPKRYIVIEGFSLEQPVSATPPVEGDYIRAMVRTEWRDTKSGKRRPRFVLQSFRSIQF